MGIQGLKTFIERNEGLLQEHHFSNSKLVIDGSNLLSTLYSSCGLDQKHGGDYDAFEEVLRLFFTNLKDCNIQPYVVIDGGIDYTDNKFDTLVSRAKTKIIKAKNLSEGGSGQVLPPLKKNIFMQYLFNDKVPFVHYVAEADWEAAALANEWNCPILSDDSDFYIFNISGGVLPISQFQWKTVVSQNQKKIIRAKLYNVKSLYSKYKIMNSDLLPIFAAVAGNDYINLDKAAGMWLNKFKEWCISLKRPDKKYSVNFAGLLTWLSQCSSPEDTISKLSESQDGDLSRALRDSIKHYTLSTSSIAQFFNTGIPSSNLPEPLQKLPEWILKRLMEGKLDSIIIDVLVHHRHILNFTVENSKLRSGNQTSRPIRQVLYGLVLGGQPEPSPSDTRKYVVEEYDREGLELTSIRVAAVLPRDFTSELHPEALHKAPLELRLKTLLDTFQISQSQKVLQVPGHLQLPMSIICYCTKNSKPKTKPEFLWALLVCLLYREMSNEVKAMLTTLKDKTKTEKLDLEVAHACSQWQCCLRDGFTLNQLLCNPVPEPHCAWLYNGTLVHGVVKKITTEHEMALRSLLPEKMVQDLFCKLLLVVEDNVRTECDVGLDILSEVFQQLKSFKKDEDDNEPERTGRKGRYRGPPEHDQAKKFKSSCYR